ncbi:hypothetical protein MJ257_02985 [Paenibacillus timonensis]|jgi:hypothetical protein|uniref:Methyltransferase n=1 Tax=Paenibacillus timonensis TaxID=225915 RepID=A0ABW3S6N2_9BACL|nr:MULTISPECIES: hypothetical protein [Paenibacillus]MCH1639058.1 hypothetical protein [Paenibacillus timonensis]MDU2242047.1 hypothetical protein [Paenibacillus sp.]GJM81726.1 hypothetical protein HMSSN139_42220 [Paenibacillus sp. HMSSN-139]
MGSFDRKVERNQLRMNKKGKGPNVGQGTRNPRSSLGANGEGDVFKGRNFILPSALFVLALLYASVGIIGNSAEVNSVLYWATIFLYMVLALAIFLRKPYLRVNKSWLYTSKFNRDRMLDAGNIGKIKVSRNKIVIEPKTREPKWVFYRTRNRFDTEAMATRLELYANTHQVKFEKE